MSTRDTRGGGEFPDVVAAEIFLGETGLDAITFILDFGKRKVEFRGNACDIESSYI